MLDARVFVGLSNTGPLCGPKLWIFAREIGQHGFHVFLLGASKDFFLPSVIADFRFDFLKIFYATHVDLGWGDRRSPTKNSKSLIPPRPKVQVDTIINDEKPESLDRV